LIGQSRAKELIFTGKIIDSDEAFSLGILTQKNEDGLLAARQIAEKISLNGPLAIKMAKSAIKLGLETDLLKILVLLSILISCRQSGLQIEKLCYSKLLNTEDRLEGLKSFSEGRPPVYKGC
jgi:methylglutaconyl-CoA hydratase